MTIILDTLLVSSLVQAAIATHPQEVNGIYISREYIGIGITVFLAIVSAAVYFGRQHQKVGNIKEDISENIKPAIKDIGNSLTIIGKGVSYIEGKIDKLSTSNVTSSKSPVVLNDKGKKILTDSGIDKIIENNYNNIISAVKIKNPVNAYDAQEIIIEVVKNLINDANLKNAIEIGAFSCGSDVQTVLYVGAINIRDKILTELNLYPKDIDIHDPTKKK